MRGVFFSLSLSPFLAGFLFRERGWRRGSLLNCGIEQEDAQVYNAPRVCVWVRRVEIYFKQRKE